MANAPRRRRAAAPRPAAAATIELDSPQAEALAAPAAATARGEREELGIPEPVAIKTVWLRASVKLPGEQPVHDRKIYVALIEPGVTGLYVYKTVPDDDFTPEWMAYMPVQPEPIRGAMARNGITLATDQGPVSITPSGACSCSAPLKRWTPAFAQRMVRWSA